MHESPGSQELKKEADLLMVAPSRVSSRRNLRSITWALDRDGPGFSGALIESLHANESTYVDLSGITFFSVAGAEALIEARGAADLQHAVLCIDMSARVRHVLEMLGIAEEFSTCTQPSGRNPLPALVTWRWVVHQRDA